MINGLPNKDDKIKYNYVLSEEFFSYFYHFRVGVMHGDKSRAMHNLEKIEEYAEDYLPRDILRLILIGMAESFSAYLGLYETTSLMKEISNPAERAFHRLYQLVEIYCR